MGIDEACPGAEGPERPAFRRLHAGGETAGDDRGTILLPEKGQVRYAHSYLFPVDSSVKKQRLPLSGIRQFCKTVQGFLYG